MESAIICQGDAAAGGHHEPVPHLGYLQIKVGRDITKVVHNWTGEQVTLQGSAVP